MDPSTGQVQNYPKLSLDAGTRGRAKRRDHEESFCPLLENRYRFSFAAQKDNGMTLADMARPDSTCLEDDRLAEVFPSAFSFLFYSRC